MIVLKNILNEIINDFQYDEPISFNKDENSQINKIVNSIIKLYPEGVTGYDVFSNFPNIGIKMQLKILIELAKLNHVKSHSMPNYRFKPDDILKMYNDSHRISNDAIKNINLNENYDSKIKEDISKVVKGFNLIKYKQGFGLSFKTTNNKATPELANKINKFLNKIDSKIKATYEKTYGTINFILNNK